MKDEKNKTEGRRDGASPVQAHLGEQLRRYYASIVSEPVPDRFASLLDELEQRERGVTQPAGEETAR